MKHVFTTSLILFSCFIGVTGMYSQTRMTPLPSEAVGLRGETRDAVDPPQHISGPTIDGKLFRMVGGKLVISKIGDPGKMGRVTETLNDTTYLRTEILQERWDTSTNAWKNGIRTTNTY